MGMGIEEDSELGIQDTQTQTVCQLAEQKVLHIKGTQLCLPHLFITFSLIQFPFPIPPSISLSLWEKAKVLAGILFQFHLAASKIVSIFIA